MMVAFQTTGPQVLVIACLNCQGIAAVALGELMDAASSDVEISQHRGLGSECNPEAGNRGWPQAPSTRYDHGGDGQHCLVIAEMESRILGDENRQTPLIVEQNSPR